MWAGASAPIASVAASTMGSGSSVPAGGDRPALGHRSSDAPRSASTALSRANSSIPPRLVPRAEASVMPVTAVAVAAGNIPPEPSTNGPKEAAPSSHLRPHPNLSRKSLSRVQSRNLSGLFAGASTWATQGRSDAQDSAPQARLRADLLPNRGPAQRPLSRIVDDDEVSLYRSRIGHGAEEDDFRAVLAEQKSRPRRLSESSIHFTYDESSNTSGLTQAPINRIITSQSLALRAGAPGPSTALDSSSDASLAGGEQGDLHAPVNARDGLAVQASTAASRVASYLPSLSSLKAPSSALSFGGGSRNGSRTASGTSAATGVTSPLSASPAAVAIGPASPAKTAALAIAVAPRSPGRSGLSPGVSGGYSRSKEDGSGSLSSSYAHTQMQRNLF